MKVLILIRMTEIRARNEFDEKWDIPQNYVSACSSNSVQLVPFHPIVMLILFHHYKELKDAFLK